MIEALSPAAGREFRVGSDFEFLRWRNCPHCAGRGYLMTARDMFSTGWRNSGIRYLCRVCEYAKKRHDLTGQELTERDARLYVTLLRNKKANTP